jgi:hypothetical protein
VSDLDDLGMSTGLQFKGAGSTVAGDTCETDAGLADLFAASLLQVLPNAHFCRDKTFYEHGGDSLSFVSFILVLALHVPEERLAQVRPDRPLRELLTLCSAGHAAAFEPNGSIIREEPPPKSTGSLPMTANRHAFLFRMLSQLDTWITVSDLYEIDLPFNELVFQRAVETALTSFDGLRLRLRRCGGRFEQEIVPLESVHAPALITTLQDHADCALRDAVKQSVEAVTLSETPFRLVVAVAPDASSFGFVVVCHHVLTDAISNGVVRRFIVEAYQAFARSAQPAPPQSIDYSQYCELYLCDCRRRRAQGLEYWRSQPWSRIELGALGSSRGVEATGESHEVSADLIIPEFGAFCSALRIATGFSVEMVAIAAIAQGYYQSTGRSHLCLGLVGHSRASLPGAADARYTVGWLTEVVPILLSAHPGANDRLAEVGERMLEAERYGRLYGYLRHLDPDTLVRDEFGDHPDPNMTLNILTAGGGSPLARRSFGWDHGWRGERVFPLSGGLVGLAGGLRLSWDFDPAAVPIADAERFLEASANSLRQSLRRLTNRLSGDNNQALWADALSHDA